MILCLESQIAYLQEVESNLRFQMMTLLYLVNLLAHPLKCKNINYQGNYIASGPIELLE